MFFSLQYFNPFILTWTGIDFFLIGVGGFQNLINILQSRCVQSSKEKESNTGKKKYWNEIKKKQEMIDCY